MADPATSSNGGQGGVEIADFPDRVRTAVCGIVIADSTHAKILREGGHPAVFYFPADDVRTAEFMTAGETRTTCPKKGEARYWSFRLADHQETDIAWTYPDPIASCAAIGGHIAFYWDRMDCWFVGDKQITAPPA